MEYLRAVEDCFAELRNQTHQLTQKEIHLAKKWWKEEIPLEAVRGGILEIIARRESEGRDRVFGLPYCRHAVKRHAKQLSAMRIGAREGWQGEDDTSTGILRDLSQALREKAAALGKEQREVAELIHRTAEEIESLESATSNELDATLFELETALLSACFEALPAQEKEEILSQAEEMAHASGARAEALDRTLRVFRDKLIRELLQLPRFE